MTACADCLRRGHLLTLLAANIDRSVGARAGERARDLLALGDRELAVAVAPTDWRAALATAGARARDGCATPGSTDPLWATCAHAGGLPGGLEALGPSQPHALFGRGDVDLITELDPDRAVTIVGSRRSGAYGREVAHELGRELAVAGIVVVSGLAQGIDSAAHEGALAGGGPTVAVLGPGADRAYPRSAGGLYRRVCTNGAVISELAPGPATFRWMFPARNRLMAALGGVTVVVEAAERSGSLITAEMAIDAGRTVGAVPGPVTSWRSSGTNRLLGDGAALVRDARDVLDLLLGPGSAPPQRRGPEPTPEGLAVLAALDGGATTADAIAAAAGIGFSTVLIALSGLERDGYVQGDHTGRWTRTTLAPPRSEGEDPLPLI
ncbi:MAG: DNA-processing protein DprA [Solirubrobacterales bacterium]